MKGLSVAIVSVVDQRIALLEKQLRSSTLPDRLEVALRLEHLQQLRWQLLSTPQLSASQNLRLGTYEQGMAASTERGLN